MPLDGGTANTYGGRYEDRWTAHCAMRVLREEASAVFLEPPGDEAAGFEFILEVPARHEYHQVKRQRTGEGRWTIAALSEAGVLKAFYDKLQDSSAVCVFASGHSAYTLEELSDRARKSTSWAQFERGFLASKTWRTHFDELTGAWGDPPPESVWEALQRVRVATIGEESLTDLVAFQAELLLDGPRENAVATLVEILRDRVNERLGERDLWSELETRGYGPNPWASGRLLAPAIDEANHRFRRSRQATLIDGFLIERPETQDVVAALAEHRTVLVQGDAGTGKSDVLLALCNHLDAERTPYLALRLDRQKAADSPEELGRGGGLPGSPPAVLAASAPGRPSVLVVDQLDALGTTSGRNPEFLDCVDAMLRRAHADPNMRVVVTCRSFDAANDGRLRRLLDGDPTPAIVTVGPLVWEAVLGVLGRHGIDGASISQQARELLSVSLHLALLTQLGDRASAVIGRLHTLRDFYDAFWDEKRRAVAEALGRDPELVAVLDALIDYMSDEQLLHAPREVVDRWRADVREMLSLSVLVEDGPRIGFFHETFFDYAFARRFTGRRLTLESLLASDQFLFRRAQVRQVLAYAREGGTPQYERDLRFLLTSPGIRFHLQDLVLAWLGTLDPTPLECDLVGPMLEEAEHHLHDRAWRAVSSPAWFRWMDNEGLLERWLAAGGELKERVLLMLRTVDEHEPVRVAAVLAPYRETSEDAAAEVDAVLSSTDLSKGRDLFNLFLRALNERADLAASDFWYITAHLPETHPDWGCELLGAYLRNRLAVADAAGVRDPFGFGEAIIPPNLHLEEFAVACGSRAPEAFVDHVLPQMIAVVRRTSDAARPGEMRRNSVWLAPHLSDAYMGLDDHLLLGAEAATQALAGRQPARLAALAAEHAGTEEETVAYLLYEGFGANPQHFADAAADFMLVASARFRVGRSNDDHWAARTLIERITPSCSAPALRRLEHAILDYFTPWERSRHGYRENGYAQFTLLSAFDRRRLSPEGRRRLSQWQRKFRADDVRPPAGIMGGFVGSPIPDEATKKMKDWQWLRAVARYGDEERRDFLKGGAHQLAQVLEQRVAEDPVRFARLARKLSDDTNVAYFDAILRGVGACTHDVPLAEVQTLVERCHALPSRPCGRWIAHPVRRFADVGIPEPLLSILGWYATEDPDPPPGRDDASVEDEQDRTLMRGLNSVRGGMAYEFARYVHLNPANIAPLEPAIRALVSDRSPDVLAMAAEIPTALLRHVPRLALKLFVGLATQAEDRVLATRNIHEFLRYRGAVNFRQLEPVIRRMIQSDLQAVRTEGAVQAALAALSERAAEPLAEECLCAGPDERAGLARVYAANLTAARHRNRCERALHVLFADEVSEVREAAADAIGRLRGPEVREFEPLLRAFLDTPAFEDHPDVVLRALAAAEPAPAELAIDACARVLPLLRSPSDIRTAGAAQAREVSDVLIRAYASASDRDTKNRALDVIDAALGVDAYGTLRLLIEHDRA